MTTTITRGDDTLAPFAMSDYTSDQDGGSILHPILGREEPDVTHRPASLRRGSFVLSFVDEAATEVARVALGKAGSWLLQNSDRPSLNMRFIVERFSRPVLANKHWNVTVQYAEIGT